MIAFFTALWARLAAWASAATFLSFLGPLAPIIAGVASALGSTITALFEILASLSKSPEGRVFLALLAGGLGFLYLRYHYIEEGKAEMQPQLAAVKRSCAQPADRRRR